ncbi:ribonuclease H-like domain-containing protein [Tanacetum coccineum]
MNGSYVDERGKTHHGKSNLFQETPKPLCSTFLPTDVKHCLNVGYTFVNFTTSEAVWKSHVCITRKSWPLFKSKKIAQVVRAWIQSKNSLVKHFEDMRLCRPSKEYLPVWFDPPRDESMSCLTTKGMRNNGAMCARRFRESLRRVTDGAEAFLILTLFILCLDKVSTDHAKLVPLGKVCTAKETLEKNTAKGTNGSSVDERGKTHHGKSNLFQETPKPLCSTFLPTDVKHCLNVGYTFVNFATSEAVWKSHVCITRKSWPLFKSKKIAQVVRAWIQSKNSLVKHFEDMRLCRPSKEYLPVWFDPPRDVSMSCLTTKGMRNNGAMCARRFRESLRRVTDGAEAFLILTLFILCLDKVSTDHAKLVPLGKVCTAKETLEKNTAKGTKCKLEPLISLTDDLSLLSNMAALESCPKHNMIAYLEKTEGNVEFHEVIDFLRRSYIYHALTVSPVVSTTFVEQFWTSAKSKTINNVRHITAKVAGKFVSISEASIRTDLIFDDADGIDSLPNQAIFDAIQLMGYEGDLTVLTFNKALFSPQWRFLFHTINHCLSSKSTSWDQIPTNIATAVICLTTNQKYNFSKLIFDGMLRHLEAKKKFVMYPRFISIFLGRKLANISVPLDHFPVNSLTSKVFSFMIKKGKHFSGKVTPLFDTMLVQPTQDEGASSERLSVEQPSPSPAPTGEVPNESLPDSSSAQPSEVPFEQQPDPSPRPSPRPSPTPSPTPIVPDSIPEPTGENLGDHSSNDASLSGNEDDMTLQNVYDLCISLCQQVSDQAKEIKLLKAKITKLKKQAKPVIKHHKEYLKIISLQQRFPKKSFSKKQRVHTKSVSKQGRKKAKGESSVQRDPLFEVLPEDKIDHMETENAQTEGRTREMVDEEKEFDEDRLSTEDVVSTVKEGVSTDFEKVSTDRPKVSTDRPKVSTDRPKVSTDESKVSTDEQVEGTEESNESTEEIFEGTEEQREGTEDKVSTDEQMEGTEDQTKEEIASKASQTSTQTPTSMTFGDDETIATLLINMSKAKAASKEKEKGVELKDVEEIDRPRPTSTRSLLTLKPLPKIDP